VTYKDAGKRALATFIAGATAVPITSAIVDISAAKAMAAAGIVAVWNLAGRWAQTVIEDRDSKEEI